jgi:hypothetical protein
MPGQVWYRIKRTQTGIFFVRYGTKILDAGMLMPALVSSMQLPSYGVKVQTRRSIYPGPNLPIY